MHSVQPETTNAALPIKHAASRVDRILVRGWNVVSVSACIAGFGLLAADIGYTQSLCCLLFLGFCSLLCVFVHATTFYI